MNNNADKTKLKSMIKNMSYDMDTLKESYGLKTDTVWFEAFDDAAKREKDYLRKMRKGVHRLDARHAEEIAA